MRDPEVHKLRAAFGLDHDVHGLNVPMDDARPVGVVDGAGQGGEEVQHLLQAQVSLLQEGLEGPAFQKLHHDVILADVVDAHDVRVGEPAGGRPLSAEPPKVLVARVVG
jgi:hypothetical protein